MCFCGVGRFETNTENVAQVEHEEAGASEHQDARGVAESGQEQKVQHHV